MERLKRDYGLRYHKGDYGDEVLIGHAVTGRSVAGVLHGR